MLPVRRSPQELWRPPASQRDLKQLTDYVASFLDVGVGGFGRATAYNSREEQERVEQETHQNLFEADRSLYAALLCLRGLNDRASQWGTRLLLSETPQAGQWMQPETEREVIEMLLYRLPITRRLQLFESFRHGGETVRRLNNARARKLILSLLDEPLDKLAWWAVKYRGKLRRVLVHALGRRRASILGSICSKSLPSAREKHLGVSWTPIPLDSEKWQVLAFVLGPGRQRYGHPLLQAYLDAHKLPAAGKRLPVEVLQGICSTYHKNVSRADVLKMGQQTEKQKQRGARAAARHGVDTEWDPRRASLVDLYTHMCNVGADDVLMEIAARKERDAAERLLLPTDNFGVVLDRSGSMYGSDEQKYGPMARALALSGSLIAASNSAVWSHVGGDPRTTTGCAGATDLASAVLSLVNDHPHIEMVFVVSDGYENAPAGRLAQVVEQGKEFLPPVVHINPVVAAEAGGMRSLGEGVPMIPASHPGQLGIGLLRTGLAANPVGAIEGLVQLALPGSREERKEVRHA